MQLKEQLFQTTQARFGCAPDQCDDHQLYEALLILTRNMAQNRPAPKGERKLYYFSAEFLMGKLLSNNLLALGLHDEVRALLADLGRDLGVIESMEPEPSLGNGGLGRLAACFLDSIAALGLPGDGVGLNYHYGLFRQKFDHNRQTEVPDPWMEADSWLIPTGMSFDVPFGGFDLKAVLYDIAIPGANNQYANRDPRLDMTVLHNGSNWLGRQLATYQGGGNNPTSSALYSRTSYYMCKFMGDYTGGSREYNGNSPHPWAVLRYAEVLLNYAEAQNEFLDAPDQSVYDCLIELRKRAGIEPGDDNLYGLKYPMSQGEMRDVIRNERRIEMAFEEQRFYDIRRWKVAGDIFENPVRGLTITNRDGVLNFAENEVLNVKWDDRRYLFPIPYSEVLKNSNMVQNPKW